MMIAEVRTRRIELKLADPQWRFVRGSIASIEGYAVEVVDDQGRSGHGYFRAMPPALPPLKALKAAFDSLAGALIGVDACAIHAVMDRLDERQQGCAPLKAAIECALYDLLARGLGQPLHALFGGMRQDTFANARIIPLKTPQAMAEVAAGLAAQSFGFLKVKLSGDAALDLARFRAVREAVGPAVRLMADANESYRPKPAIRLICQLAELGLELIEQPTAAADLEGLAQVTRAVPVTVEADESAPDLQSIWRIAQIRAADSVSLRVMNLGGITNTLRAVAVCEAAGLEWRFGAVFGASVMHAHTLQLAATLRAPSFAHEFSEFELFLDDPFRGLKMEGGTLRVPAGHGTGVCLLPV